MQRRTFLKKGLLGGALLALGGTGLAFAPTRHIAAPLRPLLVLDDRGFQVLVAAAARIIKAPGADLVTIVHGVYTALSYASRDTQEAVVKLLGLFENALPGLLLDGRLGPFTQLDGKAQDRVLERWRDSRLTL